MSPTPQSTFEERLSELMDGTITESSRDELLQQIEQQPDRLKQVAEHLAISELLSQQLPIRKKEFVLEALQDHIQSIAPREDDPFVTGVIQRIRRMRDNRRYAIAAAITIALIPLTWYGLRIWNQPIVAHAFKIDLNGNLSPVRSIRTGQSIDLTSGLMQIKFGNGAVVAVESPASFQVKSEALIQLFSGKLNAWCPETAHGFQVKTHDTLLTDLGTSFGIEATTDGPSEYVVIEGSINLRKGRQTLNLLQGDAVSTHSGSGLEAVTFETSPFERTWALTSGIIDTTGAVVPAKPDIPENLVLLRNDSEVMVVPEAQGIPFDQAIIAEITEPGHLEITTKFVPSLIVPADPNRLLHSYLIRVDPKSKLSGPEHIHYDGSVTFDRDVIAIILEKTTLEASDERFTKGKWPKVPGVTVLKNRGLEINWNTTIHDQVTLSPDRRTVTIAFHTGGSTDDIRVITAE